MQTTFKKCAFLFTARKDPENNFQTRGGFEKLKWSF